jgi:uncharacterized protein involved in exopolysaccharide biosynthesis
VVEQSSSGSVLAGALGGLGKLMGSDGLGSLTSKLNDGPSATFLADVLTSRELLTATLETRFRDPENPARTVPLLDLLDAGGRTPATRLGEGLRDLEDRVVVDVVRRSSIVSLEVKMDDPQLASAVATRMLELLNTFNLERRQRSSREQRRFAEKRLQVAQAELKAAEGAKRDFLENNRGFRLSPRLAEEYESLVRQVEIKREVLLGLTTTLEESRVAEVRDTPLITTIDRAVPPDRPQQRPLPWGAIGAVVAFLAALASAVVAVLQERQQQARRLEPSITPARPAPAEPARRGAIR